MSKLIHELRTTLPGTGTTLAFSNTKDLLRWAEGELVFWQGVDANKIQNSRLRKTWQYQEQWFNALITQLNKFDTSIESDQQQEATASNNELANKFLDLKSGKVVTKDHDFYPAMVEMAKINPELSAIILLSSGPPSGQNGQYQADTGMLVRLALYADRIEGTNDWLQPQRKELTAIRDESQLELDKVREIVQQQEQDSQAQKERADTAHNSREEDWGNRKQLVEKEWEDLKKVYNEQLALLAPTQYWADRYEEHKKQAKIYATGFSVAIFAMIGIFTLYAMPHLIEAAKTKDISPLLVLIPIAIPAFACIWILKILSRLLSENLQMMRDARERETMVKTFLALMNDDAKGKALVHDNDRILILHALFRPSSVTAADDAPPAHWFDLLTNKLGSKSTSK